MNSRRTFLKLTGGAGVIAAAGGTGFAMTRTPVNARAPWTLAGSGYAEPRMRALSYALLAPNPHNRQPWIADLSEPGAVTLTCDLDRRLPETDPPNRQITIGLGCFIELARMAAAEEGTRLAIEPFPLGEPGETLDTRPIARLTFHANDAEPDPLFDHVLIRRSVRVPFDTARPVDGDTLASLLGVAHYTDEAAGTIDRADIASLRDIATKAWLTETTTPRTHQESVRLMRIGKSEIEANPDGIELGGAFIEALSMAGIVTRETLANPDSFAYSSGLNRYKQMIDTAMGFVWLRTDGNSRTDQLRAGYDWVRLNLQAAGLGLSVHPLSQVLQEFPEMSDLYAQAHRQLGVAVGRIQMLGRIGYAPQQPPAPRWRLETRLTGG